MKTRMFEQDGHTRRVKMSEVKPGYVLRMRNFDGSIAPFSDCVVLKNTSFQSGSVETWGLKLARPYAYAHLTGTTSPGTLMNCEKFETFRVDPEGFLWGFELVMLASGEPYTYSLDRDG